MSEYSDIIEQNFGPAVRDRSKVDIFTSMDDEPERAARAIDLASDTGVPSPVIYSDLDNFEHQYKANLAGQLIDNNPHLNNYLNSNPLAAKVSHDDLGQLDSVSQKLDKFSASSVLSTAAKAFQDAYGQEYSGASAFKSKEDWEWAAKYPYSAALWAAGFSAVQAPMRTLSATITAGIAGAAEAYRQVTGDERATAVGEGLAQAAQDPGLFMSVMGIPAPNILGIFAHNAKLVAEAKPYLEAGRAPPSTLNTLAAAAHGEQAKVDAANFKEVVREVGKSATLARSPELMKNFVEEKLGQQTVGIPADVALENEGKLDFVPKLEDQLEIAALTGGDVKVPVSEFINQLADNPELAKTLEDNIRYRPDGVTIEESKTPTEPEPIISSGDSTVDAVRKQAGLEPIVETPRSAYAIEKTQEKIVEGIPTHDFNIVNAEGNPVGKFTIAEEADGKRLYVDNIETSEPIGRLAMFNLKKQVLAQFPKAESFAGLDVREKIGEPKDVEFKITKPEEKPTTKAQQLELDVTRQADKPVFKGTAINLSQVRYNKITKLIDQRDKADTEWLKAKAERDAAKQLTPEWKENLAKVNQEVTDEFARRPDLDAATYFRTGRLHGEPSGKIPRLDPKAMTPEELEMVPKEFLRRGAMNPDDAARLFDFPSGEAMIRAISEIERQRGDMQPAVFRAKLIKEETMRRMENRYGKLAENIIGEAEDHVVSPTQMELLHEQTLAVGEAAGVKDPTFAGMPFTKEHIKAWVRNKIADTPIENISASRTLTDAGRARQAAINALIDGDPKEAFRQMQRATIAIHWAAEAKKYEKLRDTFDTIAKRFSKRDHDKIDTPNVNFIHTILNKIMPPGFVKRGAADLATEIEKSGYSDLESFVASRNAHTFGMDQLNIADFLMDNDWKKPLDKLTLDEFKDTLGALQTLIKTGRDELKIIKEGEEFDKAVILDQMYKELETWDITKLSQKATLSRWDKLKAFPKVALASSTATETLLNRFDRNNRLGPFNSYVNYILAAGANRKAKMQREISKPFRDLGEPPMANKRIESPLIDPNSITPDNPQGSPLADFNMGHVQVMIHNAGSPAQWEKFARGWGADPQNLWQWLLQNSVKEQWTRAQKMGDTIWKPLFEQAQEERRKLYGYAPEPIDLQPFEVTLKDGTTIKLDGWYHPLIRDPVREYYFDADGKLLSGVSAKQRGGSVYDGPDNFHARTSDGYTKSRTKALYPIDLSPDMIPIRMTQMIHDIALRSPIIQAEKIFRDKKLRFEIARRYGTEYRDGLMPYLQGVAGEEGIPSYAMGKAKAISEFLRQNVIGTYIGFNPATALKHGPTALIMSMKQVGGWNFWKAQKDIYTKGDIMNDANKKWIDDTFEEVSRRQRHWQDTISGAKKDIYGEPTIRERMIDWGSKLVAASDMFSVRATALAAYRQELARQMAEGETPNLGKAIDLGNREVRYAHGSTAITNQPALVRGGGPLHSWMTSIYGFFGTVMQRRIELAHVINDTYKLGMAGEINSMMKKLPDLTTRVMAHVIWPIMVEEYVTGMTTEDRRGWGEHLFMGALGGLSSSVLYLRDFAWAIKEGGDPSVGLLSSPLHDLKNLINDIKKGTKALSGKQAAKSIRDLMVVTGDATGAVPKIFGTATQFGLNWAQGYEKPKGISDLYQGIKTGTMKKRIEK